MGVRTGWRRGEVGGKKRDWEWKRVWGRGQGLKGRREGLGERTGTEGEKKRVWVGEERVWK